MNIEMIYNEVRHITHRTRKEYYVHGWEVEDWDQEGMLSLYQLLETQPDLPKHLPSLYTYYKTKFRNRVIDEVRKQTNDKRKLNMSAYEDIHETGDRIQSSGLTLDEYYLFHESLGRYKESLTPSQQKQVNQLLADERFKGRKQMLRELAEYLSDFQY